MYPVIDLPHSPDHIGDPEIESRILSAATGVETSAEDLNCIGARIFNLQRAILLREGHQVRVDDLLPEEFHSQLLGGHVADPECLVPGPNGRIVSRLGEVADRLERRGLLAHRARRVPPHVRLTRRLGRGLAAGLDRLGGNGRGKLRGRMSGDPAVSAALGTAAPAMSREQLLELLEEQRLRYGHPQVVDNFKGWNKAMQYHFFGHHEAPVPR
jgi:hypothetical protein